MDREKLERMKENGFIAALDQSGGSTPKALKLYGVDEDAYKNEDEMFELVHEMRKRIITDEAFSCDRILAAILFKVTMNSKIGDKYTADYLWDEKKIVPILKVDEGLAEEKDGVKLMKEMKDLDDLLDEARKRHIFGTKMRSVIYELNEKGIRDVVDQQFKYALKIASRGFVPIIEPEVDINAKDKAKIEELLRDLLVEKLKTLKDEVVMFKLTLPEVANLYEELLNFKNTLRIVALSGGYSREESNRRLSENKDVVASFSRALTEGLSKSQSDEEFHNALDLAIEEIYRASIA